MPYSFSSYNEARIFTITCGLISHLIFNKFEPHSPGPLFGLLFAFPLLPSLTFLPFFRSWFSAYLAGFLFYYASLSTSVICYRLSPFHPLSNIPGPFWAKVSKLWGLSVGASGKQYRVQQWVHRKYGPYVRTGPNEVSICDKDAFGPIMGTDGMPKGPAWDGRRHPSWPPSVVSLREQHEHLSRRRKWNRAFTSVAVKDYEPFIRKRALQLADEVEKRSKENSKGIVDLSMMFSYFAADFMGDIVFGGGFELMRDGDQVELWSMIEEGMKITSILGHLPWANWIFYSIPRLTAGSMRIREFSVVRALERKKNGSMTKDLFYHLIDENHEEPTPPTTSEILSDSDLAIIAGSDTTASGLSNTLFYLLSDKTAFERLRAEVDEVFPPEGEPFDSTKLAGMEFLNAVINESLRLRPPVNGTMRAPEPGSGGKVVGPHFFPEGTQLAIPMYTLHRNPEYFSPYTSSFVPDRWLKRSSRLPKYSQIDFKTEHGAFVPFSHGPANCAGKNLAIVEMRMVLALLVQRFDAKLGGDLEGFVMDNDDIDSDGTEKSGTNRWEEQLEDWFVLTRGPLPVVITPRV